MLRITNKYAILLLLTLAYMLSFMDRYVMNLLLSDAKRDFQLSEMQAGLLAGAGFAVFYALMALPMGLLADRYHRTRLAAIGIAFWSVMTLGCGMAKSFVQLLLARTGVGVGEASLTPAAYPTIKILFSSEKLSTAIGIYSAGIYLGSGLAYWLGGKIIFWLHTGRLLMPQHIVQFDWQWVFFFFGIPGIVIGAFLLLVKLPAMESNASKGYTLKEVNAFLTEKNYFFLKFAMASALFNVAVYAAGVWLPTFLQRCYQLDTAASGKLLGIAMLTVAPVGAVAGGYIGDRFSINRVKAIVSTIFMVMICFTLLLFSPTGYFQYIPLFLLCLTMGMPVAITAAAVQEIAPEQMRSFAPAFLLMIQNLLGMSLGPAIVALFTQYVFRNEMYIGYSIAITGFGFCLAAIILFRNALTSNHE